MRHLARNQLLCTFRSYPRHAVLYRLFFFLFTSVIQATPQFVLILVKTCHARHCPTCRVENFVAYRIPNSYPSLFIISLCKPNRQVEILVRSPKLTPKHQGYHNRHHVSLKNKPTDCLQIHSQSCALFPRRNVRLILYRIERESRIQKRIPMPMTQTKYFIGGN